MTKEEAKQIVVTALGDERGCQVDVTHGSEGPVVIVTRGKFVSRIELPDSVPPVFHAMQVSQLVEAVDNQIRNGQ